MLKPRGAICNLDCHYCFYLDKETFYPGSSCRMSDELLDSFTRQYIEAQRVPTVTFAWQGGEPTLMGLNFFRKAVELQQKYRKRGMHILNAFQTNGTLLDDAWCAFFKENDFLIGISLDGPRALHDAYRVDKGGQPTFDRVMRGLSFLHKHQVEFNVLTCIHSANAPHPLEVYDFLRDEAGARFIQFIPIVERAAALNNADQAVCTARSVTGKQYGQFLTAIFDQWVRRDVGSVYVQIFDAALAAWSGHRPGLCVFEPTCGHTLAMEHNGDLYACDHFVEPRYRLGNIEEQPLPTLIASDAQLQFGQAKRDALPRCCRECDVGFACNGGCPKNRVLVSPDNKPDLNYLCAGYKAFFTYIDWPMRFMANELAHHRPPANIMLYLAREELERQRQFALVGRNDPCPCGSGLKYKKCCGKPQKMVP
jgi:uncharacterized protein